MELLNNLDLLSIGFTVAAIGTLGFAVFFSNRKSVTNQAFLYFSIITILYSLTNYLSYKIADPEIAFLVLRLTIFFAVWHAFTFFYFFYVYPYENIPNKKIVLGFLIPTILVSLLTFTNFIFQKVVSIGIDGRIVKVQNGPGIILFGILVLTMIVTGFVSIIRKRIHASEEQKKQLQTILEGTIVTFSLLLIFNFIFPAFLNNPDFISWTAIFIFPFIIFTSYAILKHHLFNVKVVTAAILVFALTSTSFIEIITTRELNLILLRGSVFIIILIVGILLLKSVLDEVEQREKLQVLTKELEGVNVSLKNLVQQRESLVHLVTHKVKGSFTKTKYIFAGMLDGTFGEVNDEIKKRAVQGLESDNTGIETIDLVLNAANLQKGNVKYDMKNIDFKEIVLKTIEDKKGPIETKGLKLETNIQDGTYTVLGDMFWLKEVVHNLIDNSLKYTKEGKMTVGLEKKDGKILFSVKDTGVGITDEDKKKLFTEGGRGKDSVKVNVDSTGYGLYTVKLIVGEHKGRVWAESEGAGKGSAFYVELDAV